MPRVEHRMGGRRVRSAVGLGARLPAPLVPGRRTPGSAQRAPVPQKQAPQSPPKARPPQLGHNLFRRAAFVRSAPRFYGPLTIFHARAIHNGHQVARVKQKRKKRTRELYAHNGSRAPPRCSFSFSNNLRSRTNGTRAECTSRRRASIIRCVIRASVRGPGDASAPLGPFIIRNCPDHARCNGINKAPREGASGCAA